MKTMKYLGRISLVSFSLLVFTIKSFYENHNLLTFTEAVFFGIVAYGIGWIIDRFSHLKRAAEMNEKRYRDIIEFLPEPVLIYHNERILIVNYKLEKLLQLKAAEIIGKSIFDFVMPEFHSAVQDRIHQATEGNPDVNRMEIKIVNSQKILLDIEVSSKPIIYDNKPFIEVFLKDVTERKKLEEDLRKKEELYRFVTENSTDMISYIKPNGEYEYLSPSCHEILGFAQAELIGQQLFSLIHPEETETITQFVNEAIYHLDFASFPHRLRKKDGTFTWLETNARTIRNEKKELVGIVTVSRDINQRMTRERLLLEKNEELLYLAKMDGLTDIPNRRFFEETLHEEWQRNRRNSTPLSLLMIDIDYFKNYNDQYGHQAGDLIIKEIAKAIQSSLKRSSDFVARYGGEEFVVLLPETDKMGAMQVAEGILANIRNLQIKTDVSEIAEQVTISIGSSTIIPDHHKKTANLIRIADRQLYAAKEAGKNQVK